MKETTPPTAPVQYGCDFDEEAPLPSDGTTPHPMRGVLLLVAAVCFFSCLDVLTKHLATHYSVPLVMAVRYIVHCSLMLILLAPSQGMQLIQTRRTGLVILRGGCLLISSLFLGLALRRMPVAETTAVNFLAPMVVLLVARPVLGERIGLLGWTAAVTGFLGVLLVARPGSGLDVIGVACVLCVVAANVVYQLLSRVLARTERTVALLFHSALIGSIFFGLGIPWFWNGAIPPRWDLLLFLLVGVVAGSGHLLFTAAYRYAPAALLAPMTYMQLPCAVLLGWFVFGHTPDALTLLGMSVVLASGIMIALRSRRTAG